MNVEEHILSQAEQKLFEAVKKGHFFIFRLLSKNPEVDLNAQDELGNTITHYAAKNRDVSLISYLSTLDRVDLSIENKQHQRPVDLVENKDMAFLLTPRVKIRAAAFPVYKEVKFKTRASESNWMPAVSC